MRFIGIDLHHDNMVVAIIDSNNKMSVIRIKLHSEEFNGFLSNLTKEDYVAIEASTNTFWFYDLVEEKVLEAYVINTWKFLEMFKTNKKTDKIDAKTWSIQIKKRGNPSC